MAGETLVFLGNCQALALASVYRTHIAPFEYQNVIHVASYRGSAENRRALDQADIVVVQKLDFSAEVTAGDLRPGVRRLEFPMVAAGFLWPYAGRAHPCNTMTQGFDGPYPPQLGDSFLNQMIRNGATTSEALERYVTLDIVRHAGVERLFELYMERQRIRDAATGHDLANVIERYLPEECLFFTPSHPNSRIFREIFTRICDQLGVSSTHAKRAMASLKVPPFPKDQLPLHPGVIRHFGLRFADEGTRYRHINQGSYTFREFVQRYMEYAFDSELDQGIRRCLTGGEQASIDMLRAGLERVPRSAQGHYALSIAMSRRGELDAAIDSIQTAIALEPNEAQFHALMGDLLMKTERWERAIVSFSLASELGDRNVYFATQLARLRAMTGDPAEAERQYRSVLDLDRDGHCHSMLTHFLARQDRLGEAMLTAQTAAALGGNDPRIRELMGNLLMRTGNPAGAEAEMRIAIQLAPETSDFHNGLSRALAFQQRIGEASSAARRAVELAPGNAHFRAHLGALLLRAEELDAAEQQTRLAVQLEPGVAHFHDILSRVLARKQLLEEAIAMARRAVELDGGNPHYRGHLDTLLHNAVAV